MRRREPTAARPSRRARWTATALPLFSPKTLTPALPAKIRSAGEHALPTDFLPCAAVFAAVTHESASVFVCCRSPKVKKCGCCRACTCITRSASTPGSSRRISVPSAGTGLSLHHNPICQTILIPLVEMLFFSSHPLLATLFTIPVCQESSRADGSSSISCFCASAAAHDA